MNAGSGALVRLTVKFQTVAGPVGQLDAPVHVAHPDARALGGQGPTFVQQGGRHLRRHTQPVVGHINVHIVPFPPDTHRDAAVIVLGGHAVVDGIFQKGLDDQLQAVKAHGIRLTDDFKGEFVLVTDALDGHVVARVVQLAVQRDHPLAPAQRDAEQPSQRRDHADGILVAATFGEPDHRVQRVIQKMRFHLFLKRAELRLSFQLLFLHQPFHEKLKPVD